MINTNRRGRKLVNNLRKPKKRFLRREYGRLDVRYFGNIKTILRNLVETEENKRKRFLCREYFWTSVIKEILGKY